jgi:hypothetical protein
LDRNEAVKAVKHFPRRNFFKKRSSIYIHDASLDEIKTDRRGRSRTIKTYVAFNRGKDYNGIKAQFQSPGATFSVETTPTDE